MASIQTSRSTPPDSHSDSAKAAASWVLPDDLSQSCASGSRQRAGAGSRCCRPIGDERNCGPGRQRSRQARGRLRPGTEAFGQRRHRPGPDGPGRPAGGRGAHGGPLTGGTGTGWLSRTGMIPFPAFPRSSPPSSARPAGGQTGRRRPSLPTTRADRQSPSRAWTVSRANGIRMPPRSGKTRPARPGPIREGAGACPASRAVARLVRPRADVRRRLTQRRPGITACPGQPLARERFWTAFLCGRRRGR